MATELGVGYLSLIPDGSKLPGLTGKLMTDAGKTGAKAFGTSVSKNLGGVSKAFGAAGKQAGEALAKQALAAAKSDISKLSKQMATATDAQAGALGRLRVAQEKLTEVQGQAKPKASAVAAAEEAVANAQRKANSATSTAESVTKSLTAAQGRAKTAADDVAKAQANAGSQSAKAGGGAGNRFTQAFKAGFKPDGSALNKIDGKREGKALAVRFGGGFNGMFGGVVSKSAVLLATAFATVGIGGLVTDSIGLEASFSQTMNTMAAVAKVPAAEMKGLSDLAIKMGADTTFSAAEAGTAMLELAKGGLSAATIEAGGLEGTLTLAAAGGLGLADASTIASNALNTFSLKGSDMASVAAALAGGANASSASVESLGQALSQVGPGAGIAGLSLQDTVGVLSSFDAAGIKGSDAGTSLKTMLTRLVPSTDKAAGAMKDLGLKFTDANGEFVPITNVAEQLRLKLGELSAEQQTTALSTIFGSDATRAASVLMKEGAVGIGQYIKATQDQNAANEVAAARMSGTAGAWESFKGSVETAKLQLGLFLAPTVQAGLAKVTAGVNNIVPGVKALSDLLIKGDFTGQFAKVFNVEEDSPLVGVLLNARSAVISLATGFKAFSGFLVDNAKTIGIVTGIIAAIFIPHYIALGVAATISGVKQAAAWLATKAGAISSAAVHSATVIGTVAGWVVMSTVAMANAIKMGAAWFIALGPVGWVIGGIVAVVAAVVTLWKTNDGFRNALISAWNAITAAAGVVWGVIKTAVGGIGQVLQAVGSRIYPIFVLPFFVARKLITWYITGIVFALTTIAGWVSGFFKKAWSAVTGVLSGPINNAKTNIGRQIGFVRDIFTAVKDWAVGAFSKAWGGLTAKLTGPINVAKTAIGTILGAGKGGLQWIFSQAVASIGKIWNGLQDLAKAPVKFIVNTVLNDGLIGAFNWVAGKFQAPTIPTIPLPKGFEDGGHFTGRLPGRPSAVDNMLGWAKGKAVGLATGEFITNAKDTARNLPLLRHINSGGDVPGFADGGLFGKLKGFATNALSTGKDLGGDVFGFLKDPVKWFKDKLSGPLNRMSELGSSPMAEIVKQVPRSIVNTVSGKAKDLLGLGGGGGPINAGLAGVLQWVQSQVGKPYVWGGVGPGGYDCSGLVSAAINVALGRNPHQRLGATGSMPWSMFAPGPGAFQVGWFQGSPGHTAATVNGTNIESRGGRGVLMGPSARGAADGLFTNRMHVQGFANGGLLGDAPFDELDPRGKAFTGKAIVPRAALSFDSGQGYIPPGYSTVFNGTGAPEPLTRTDEDMNLGARTVAALASANKKAFRDAMNEAKFRLVGNGGSYTLQMTNG